jgi:hypothetical protein
MLSGMVEIVANNPASILIVLGFFALLGGNTNSIWHRCTSCFRRTWAIYDDYRDNRSCCLAPKLTMKNLNPSIPIFLLNLLRS